MILQEILYCNYAVNDVSLASAILNLKDPESKFAVHCWKLAEREKNLRDVEAGPEWRAEALWMEVFGP